MELLVYSASGANKVYTELACIIKGEIIENTVCDPSANYVAISLKCANESS